MMSVHHSDVDSFGLAQYVFRIASTGNLRKVCIVRRREPEGFSFLGVAMEVWRQRVAPSFSQRL